MGDMDLVRALGLAGIRSACMTRPGWPPARSRFTRARVEWADNWGDPAPVLENLLAFAVEQPEPPPLFYQHDGDLTFVSGHRDVLREHFRFTIADAELIEQCLDKTQFIVLAKQLGLPIPRSVVLWPGVQPEPPELDLEPPLIVKPLTRRDDWWRPLAGHAKALEIHTLDELAREWPRFAEAGVDMVVQECVPGGEDRIESYHGYVDPSGEVAAEFTGRKVRTYPREYGETTACEITDAGDVRELGRECMRTLGLTGVAKLDFKRAPDGALRLLEANPRFNLWHLPGAAAGVNIPAVVYADLLDLPRPPVGPVRPGVRWSAPPWHDLRAARENGTSLARWAAWQARCETRHNLALDDPMPFVGGMVIRRLRARAGAR
ncbi:MAG: ATP-grasp domain-containing protein [Actinomycetota bacterium]|nr:ATP-grasp domain-containing protein [Actinomycetota bacterium]